MESKLVYWLWLHETPAESQAKISRTLFHFVSIAFIARIIYVIITLFVQPSRSSLLTYSALYHLFVLVIVAYLLRRDKILLGGLLWSTSWWLVQCFTTLSTGIGSIAFHSFYFVVIFVSTFLQIKWLVLLLSVTITIGVIENIARMSDWFTPIPFPSPNPIMQTLIILLIIIVNASIVIYALYTLYTRRSMILWQLEERLGVLKNLYSSQQFFSEKEKLLEEINNNLPGLVYKFLVSPEKNYPVTYVSKQSSALLGIDPNPDTFTKQFHQHLHPDDLAENLAMMITAASQKKPYESDMRFIKPDGNVIWLHSACSPVNENGTEYVGILTDITQTKNLERQLSEKEEQLNAIMDNPLVGIMVADETAKVIEVNHVFEQFVGKKRHQLINTYIWDLMGEMNQSGFRSDTYISIYKQKILDSLEKGYIQFSPMEVITIEKPSGERLVLHQNVFIFKTHKGIRIGALMIDLTELEAERKAKQDSETAYRALFEQGPFEISVSRLSGEITDVNDQFCANMGRPRWEILGKSSIELGRFTEEQVRQLREYSSKHSGIIDQYEMTQKVNNQERTVLLSSRVITQQNQPVAITIVLDISERKAAEQKIIHQLEELNGLRNIDTSILMGSDLTGTLTTVLQQAVTSLQIQTTQMLLYGNLNEQLIKVAESGNLLPIEPRFEDTEYPAWKVIREGRTVFIREDGIVSLPEHLQEILKINNIKMYCATPIIVNNRIQGVLEGFVDRDLTPIDPEWINYFETLAGQAAIAISNSELIKSLQKKNEELLEAYESTIVGWANALEIRDEETFGHSERVLALSIKVAHELKMDEKSIPDFRRGVLLHDIGKIGIPDSILMKPGSLDESEWIIMRQHPVFAYQLLKGVSFLKHALDVPYCHHERWNGTGYPRGLKGEDIPLPARIFSVVDVWDALTNDRPYRKAWSKEKTLDYLKENAGTQFDPHVVDLFIDLITKGSTNPE